MNFLKLEAVKAKTALGRSTIYKYADEGLFPKQIPLGGRGVAWREDEVDQWMQDRLLERDKHLPALSVHTWAEA